MMKLQRFFSLISLISITTVVTLAQYQSVNSQDAPAMKPEGSMMKPVGMAMRSGKFVKAEHPTQGTVMLVSEAGKSYLTFDQTFKTDAGPDLQVILYRTSQPPIGGIQKRLCAGRKIAKGVWRSAV
jgi:hypothetical protein